MSFVMYIFLDDKTKIALCALSGYFRSISPSCVQVKLDYLLAFKLNLLKF